MFRDRMRLIVLNDNKPGEKCSAEHGLSFLIEDDKKILFDIGPSDIFLKNAQIRNSNDQKILVSNPLLDDRFPFFVACNKSAIVLLYNQRRLLV